MNDLSQAIRELRTALGESQKEFASRMQTSQATVARWETGHEPGPHALAALTATARELRLEQAKIFEAVAKGEGVPAIRRIRAAIPDYRNDEELDIVNAVLRILRKPDLYPSQAKAIRKALEKPTDDIRQLLADLQLGKVNIPAAMLQLHNEGRSDQEIANLFKLDPADVMPVIIGYLLGAQNTPGEQQ